MTPDHASRLTTHISQVTNALLHQVSSDGCIRSTSHDGATHLDLPAMYHLIELLRALDPNVFREQITFLLESLISHAGDTLFAMDSISAGRHPDLTTLDRIKNHILATQLDNGAFTCFTAYLHGGDFFSTAWSLKILCNLREHTPHDPVARAVQYLLANIEDSGIGISQLGFVLWLLCRHRLTSDNDKISNLARKLSSSVQIDDTLGGLDFVTFIYLLEDLLESTRFGAGDYMSLALSGVTLLFDLDQEARTLPPRLCRNPETMSESAYLQGLSRACILGLDTMTAEERHETTLATNDLIHRLGRKAAHLAVERGAEVNRFLEKYGSLHREFEVYNDHLESIWKHQHTFDRGVFIMMPFKRSLTLDHVTSTIKKECAKHGFKAIRVDDADRRFSDRLWDNLVINMLSCRQAIAIYMSDPIYDALEHSGEKLKMFPNPNVALEFGFFKSRGQKILLLKEAASPLPSDLQGYYWSPFDPQAPDNDVALAVQRFLAETHQSSSDGVA